MSRYEFIRDYNSEKYVFNNQILAPNFKYLSSSCPLHIPPCSSCETQTAVTCRAAGTTCTTAASTLLINTLRRYSGSLWACLLNLYVQYLFICVCSVTAGWVNCSPVECIDAAWIQTWRSRVFKIQTIVPINGSDSMTVNITLHLGGIFNWVKLSIFTKDSLGIVKKPVFQTEMYGGLAA